MADTVIKPEYLRVLAEDIERTWQHHRAENLTGLAADARMKRHLDDIRAMLPANSAPAWTGEAADVVAGIEKLKGKAAAE